MQTCETCRHWRKGEAVGSGIENDPRWGSCRAGHEMVSVEGRYTLAMGGELDTRIDFGCIAHEPRD